MVDSQNDKNSLLEPSSLWTTVLEGNEQVIESYPDHTLFICWPDPRTKAGGRALKKYKRKYVIYIGYDVAKRSAWMGDEEFYEAISSQFKLIKTVTIPTWPVNDDKLYVFERF